jgi:hypothetical protein
MRSMSLVAIQRDDRPVSSSEGASSTGRPRACSIAARNWDLSQGSGMAGKVFGGRGCHHRLRPLWYHPGSYLLQGEEWRPNVIIVT